MTKQKVQKSNTRSILYLNVFQQSSFAHGQRKETRKSRHVMSDVCYCHLVDYDNNKWINVNVQS